MMLVTYTGKKIDYNNITKDVIDKEDIFQSMSRINRFIGHSTRGYTVGEHLLACYLVAHHLGYSNRLKLLTFMHDFSEAYTGDCPTPLKAIMPDFKKIEKEFEYAIYDYFEVNPPTEEEHELIKRIDVTMLAIEMRDLTLHNYKEYIDERTYLQILDSFKITEYGYSESELKEIMSFVMNELLALQ